MATEEAIRDAIVDVVRAISADLGFDEAGGNVRECFYEYEAEEDRSDSLMASVDSEPRVRRWGVQVTGAIAHTQGGLLVDSQARVLRNDGRPISGLLAAGGTVTGISGHGAGGYSSGNGLAQAFALGVIAAEKISGQTYETVKP